MKRFLFVIMAVFVVALNIYGLNFTRDLSMATKPCATTDFCNENQNDLEDFQEDISQLFTSSKSNKKIEDVYLGGYPLGITIDGEGVTVVGLNEFVAENGNLCCPAIDCGLMINDVIVELGGHKIYSSAKLIEVAFASNGKPLVIKFLRDGNVMEGKITPCKDLSNGNYRLGLWSRDCSGGVGTLTYVKKDLSFGCLGHPICDSKGGIIKCSNGGVFHCNIEGVKRGQVGSAGELKGSLNFENRLGNLLKNNKFGAYGTFSTLPDFCKNTIEVATISQVKPGKAQIFCAFEDGVRRSYEIKIVKATAQTSRDDKGMVIVVTDKELLQKTGGIVQGMSGSPIVQDGKLVGAVTHVFVNDPTRGYGIYAEWMLTN